MSDLFERRFQCLQLARSMFEEYPSPTLLFNMAERVWEFANSEEIDEPAPTVVETETETATPAFPDDIEPYDYQCVLANLVLNQRRLVISKARQMGVTTVLVACAAHIALAKPGQTIAILSKDVLLQNFFNRLSDCFSTNEVTVHNRRTITLANGSTIIGRTPTIHALRGLSVDVIIMDEAQCDYNEVIRHFPQDARMIVAATPTEPSFYELWRNQDWHQFTLPFFLHPDRDENYVQKLRQQFDETTFRREYCCEFTL